MLTLPKCEMLYVLHFIWFILTIFLMSPTVRYFLWFLRLGHHTPEDVDEKMSKGTSETNRAASRSSWTCNSYKAAAHHSYSACDIGDVAVTFRKKS